MDWKDGDASADTSIGAQESTSTIVERLCAM
jgi:hypothetical protein